MLHDPLPAARHDLIGKIALQNQAEQRFLRKDAVNEGKDFLILCCLQHIFQKARAVIGIDVDDPACGCSLAESSRIHSEVSTFGVAADPDRTVRVSEDGGKVLRSPLLSRCSCFERKIKILLPAHQRVISSPKGYIDRSVTQKTADCRHLFIICLRDPVYEARQLHVPEPGAAAELFQNKGRFSVKGPASPHFFLRMLLPETAAHVPDSDAGEETRVRDGALFAVPVPPGSRYDRIQFHISKNG